MKRNIVTIAVLFSMLFVLISCSISVSVAIPPFELDFELKPVPPVVISAVREDFPGEETAEMHWDRVDTQGRRIRDLNLTMEVTLVSEEELDFEDFDFELYMQETGLEEEFWFNSGSISAATATYTWNLDKENSPAVNHLVNLINEGRETDLLFRFKHNYGEGASEGARIETYGNIDITIKITGVAEVAII